MVGNTGIAKTIRQKFEDIKMINPDNKDYWSARDLMEVLGYEKWDKFQNVINKAIISAKKSGNK